jgi:DNA-binding transcriptional regulator YhcF (GntR family)
MDKPVDVYKRKLVESKSGITTFVSTTSNDNENAPEASHQISYQVAKASEAHTKSKNPIGPCIKDVVHSMW